MYNNVFFLYLTFCKYFYAALPATYLAKRLSRWVNW